MKQLYYKRKVESHTGLSTGNTWQELDEGGGGGNWSVRKIYYSLKIKRKLFLLITGDIKVHDTRIDIDFF